MEAAFLNSGVLGCLATCIIMHRELSGFFWFGT